MARTHWLHMQCALVVKKSKGVRQMSGRTPSLLLAIGCFACTSVGAHMAHDGMRVRMHNTAFAPSSFRNTPQQVPLRRSGFTDVSDRASADRRGHKVSLWSLNGYAGTFGLLRRYVSDTHMHIHTTYTHPCIHPCMHKCTYLYTYIYYV